MVSLQDALDAAKRQFRHRSAADYSAIPAFDGPFLASDRGLDLSHHELKGEGRRPLGLWTKAAIAGSLLASLVALAGVVKMAMASSHHRAHALDPTACADFGACKDVDTTSWGQYSPYFPVHNASDPSGLDEDSCEVTFALVLSRHGARDPTSRKSELYLATIQRIQDSVTDYAQGFEWLGDFEYALGADDLTAFGEQEMVDLGTAFYQRYEKLAAESDPFVRAAGSGRVIASAENFTRGFFDAKGEDGPGHGGEMLVIPEEEGYNNTLNSGMCPAFESGPASEIGHAMQRAWMEVFLPPIRDRLNDKLPGANISFEDIISLMDLCPFATVSTLDLEPSRFCYLFTADEWKSYDYYEALDKWYGHGPGNPLGPTQGVGFVNELIARLTGKPVEDETSTNSTLDSAEETFPLGRTLYADFSHDNLMTSVYGALDLFGRTDDLPPRERRPAEAAHGYSASWTVPFAGRMFVEKMQCAGFADEVVRVVLNDRVMPLESCSGGSDSPYFCTMGDFVESLSFARGGGRWDACFK